jgi:exodeoxyribonuclease III
MRNSAPQVLPCLRAFHGYLSMRIISLNVNGIRSATTKGLAQWLETSDLRWDVLCLQEIKADEVDVPDALRAPAGSHSAFYSAQKKGYSGTGLLAKKKPDRFIKGFGVPEFDNEGRYLQADFGNLSVISVYFPSGAAGPERQASKFRFLEAFIPHMSQLKASGREIILCGDVNIAHKEIDLKNWKSNQKNSGFLPEERAWLTSRFDEDGWVDVFRRIDQREERYTWWSNRGQAYANNVGWRLDYQIATPGIAAKCQAAGIYTKEKFSDHAPLVIDYEYAM